MVWSQSDKGLDALTSLGQKDLKMIENLAVFWNLRVKSTQFLGNLNNNPIVI